MWRPTKRLNLRFTYDINDDISGLLFCIGTKILSETRHFVASVSEF